MGGEIAMLTHQSQPSRDAHASVTATRCLCLQPVVSLQVHDLIGKFRVGLLEGVHLGHHLLVAPLRSRKRVPQTLHLHLVCGRRLRRRRAGSRRNGRNRPRRRRCLLQLRYPLLHRLRPILQGLNMSRVERTAGSDRLCVAHEKEEGRRKKEEGKKELLFSRNELVLTSSRVLSVNFTTCLPYRPEYSTTFVASWRPRVPGTSSSPHNAHTHEAKSVDRT